MFAPIPSSPEAAKLIEAIRDQTEGQPPNMVFVLDIVSVRFGGYFTPEIKAEIERYPYLQMLTLNDCSIKSLANFPHLPGLIRLDLVFNEITGESLSAIKGSRHLQTLMLGANRIEKIEQLEQLRGLRQLLQLDLINNPVSKLPGFRERMFTLFPTMTILDTLDKSGKDAYTSSSMALTVARVPDTLFDRSAPTTAPVAFPPVPPVFPSGAVSLFAGSHSTGVVRAASKSKGISRPFGGSSVAAPLAVSASTSSVGRSAVLAPRKTERGKLAKTAKRGKTAVGVKSRSASTRAGLVFPVGRIKRKIKQAMPTNRVTKSTAVYLAGVLEYLTAELVQIAGNAAKNDKKQRILPIHIKQSMKADQQMSKLLSEVILPMNAE